MTNTSLIIYVLYTYNDIGVKGKKGGIYENRKSRFIKGDVKWDIRAEIAQLFDFTPLFQHFIILDMYLQRMESLTEVT